MVTLAELASHFELYAVCGHCHRMARIDVHFLAQELGGQSTTDDVRARVRCRACGRRTQDIRIVYAGPCGGARGFHYRRGQSMPGEEDAGYSESSSVPSSVNPKPVIPT